MITVSDAVDHLYDNFNKYSGVIGAGEIRKITIKMIDDYVNVICEQIVANTNKKYLIESEYKVEIDKNFSIKIDRAIIDILKRKIKIHIEQKFYGDIDMLKRYALDAECLLQYDRDIINVAFCLQPATSIETFISMSKKLTHVKYDSNLFLFTLTDTSRSSSKDHSFLLTHKKQDIIDRTQLMIDKLSKLL